MTPPSPGAVHKAQMRDELRQFTPSVALGVEVEMQEAVNVYNAANFTKDEAESFQADMKLCEGHLHEALRQVHILQSAGEYGDALMEMEI